MKQLFLICAFFLLAFAAMAQPSNRVKLRQLEAAPGSGYYVRSVNDTAAWFNLATSIYNQTIRDDGTPMTQRAALNFVSTSTVNAVATDDSGSGETEVAFSVIPGGVDHGGLAGLSDDDHAQYALLAGRASGQTLNGGTASAENLNLSSTAHATKGNIVFSTVGMGWTRANLNDNMIIQGNTIKATAGRYNYGWGENIFSASMGSTNDGNIAIGVNNLSSINHLGADNNIALGTSVLDALTSGNRNVGIGVGSLGLVNTGSANVAIGESAAANVTSGGNNFALGDKAMATGNHTSGIAIGSEAMRFSTTGSYNIGIGFQALYSSSGNNTVAIGRSAGYVNTGGGVYIGYQSGAAETNTNRLYIDNSSTTAPLLGGNFSSNYIGVNTAVASLGAALHVTGTGATSATVNLFAENSSGTDLLYLDNSGQLGLLTNLPARTLHIAGEARITDLTTDTPTRIVGADADGDLGAITVGSGLSLSAGTLTAPAATTLYTGDGSISTFRTVTLGDAAGLLVQDTSETVKLSLLADEFTPSAILSATLDDNTDGTILNITPELLTVSQGAAGDFTLFSVADGGVAIQGTVSPVNLGVNTSATTDATLHIGGGVIADPDSLTYSALNRIVVIDSLTGRLHYINRTDISGGGVTDHGALTGLSDDDHTQYLLLAGRATGQVATGGTASGDDLTLRSTTNATKGDIIIQDQGGNMILGGGATVSNFRIMEASGSGTEWTQFRTQPQSASVTYILPADNGDPGEVLQTNGTGTLSWEAGGLGTDVQEYPTAGTDSYVIPAGVRTVQIICIGGGGGGGSGRRGATTEANTGGGGGGGGAYTSATFAVSELSSTTLDLTIGAGASGGASRTTDNTSGADGGTGGDTYVECSGYTIILAEGGDFGRGGSTAEAAGGSANDVGDFFGYAGASSPTSGTPASTAGTFTKAAGGGGAGGSIATGGTPAVNGGACGKWNYATLSTIAGGTAPGGNGNDCPAVNTQHWIGGNGGSGGASSITGNAGTGGTGAQGGGGGGGGASLNATGNSGAGGTGGAGFIMIIAKY